MKPFPTILVLCALALLGYVLLPRLTIRWQPSVTAAVLQVAYDWPGASPQVIEARITAPLEAVLALVRDVEEIRSVSRDGRGSIRLEIADRADEDFVRFNVASQLRRLYPDLPAGVSYPTLTYATTAADNDTETPVLTYSLSGPADPTELYRYAREQLAPQLSLQPGLSSIEVTGGNRMHWRISLDPARLAVAGFSADEVRARLTDHFERGGLGFVRDGGELLYAYRADLAKEIDALAATDWLGLELDSPSGRRYGLDELAVVDHLPLPPTSYYRINGANNVRLLAYATADANQLSLANELGTRVSAQIPNLPRGYELRLEEDATKYVREELRKTRHRAALSMGVLLFFVLVAYRSFRQLGIVLFALVVNLGLAFLLYWAVGVELNLYAFAGIAVSFGIMIDNIIIMLDALRREGYGGRVGAAVAGATLTTLASLSVIFFLSVELRNQLFELARVMTINLSTSVVIALLLVPVLLANSKARTEPADGRGRRLRGAYARLIGLLICYRKTALLLVVLAFGIPTWWLPNKVEGWSLYNDTLGSDYYRDGPKPYVDKYLGGSFRLFSYYVYGGSGFRRSEETKLFVEAALPDGATVDQLNDVYKLVERHLAVQPEGAINQYTTRVSSGQQGSMEITFPNGGLGPFPYALKNSLTALATDFGGVEWDIYGIGQGFDNASSGGRSDFFVQLEGYDQPGLDRYAARLERLLSQHPRVKDLNTDANINWWERDRSEYVLTYQRAELARRQLTLRDLRAALDWFDGNERPDMYLRGHEPVAINVQLPEGYDRWRLENWSVPLDTGSLSFPTVAALTKRIAPPALHKVDQQYLRVVAFDYTGSPQFGEKHLEACLDTLEAELALGFSVKRLTYSRKNQAREMSYLMGLAVVLIFFICALLFESLRQAFSIVMLIPVSCIGIFLTFYWFDVRLDQGGYTSFLLVAGLAVNGLILIVNEYNYLVKQDGAAAGARCYGEAMRRKLTPILLTVASTAAGMAPFLLGGREEVFWYALAAGTIGGLVFSIFVILVISPLFFLSRPAEVTKSSDQ